MSAFSITTERATGESGRLYTIFEGAFDACVDVFVKKAAVAHYGPILNECDLLHQLSCTQRFQQLYAVE